MAKDSGFHEYVMGDLFQDDARVHSRAMFGGWGIYHDTVMFALIAEGELYVKSGGPEDDAYYEAAESHPFVYRAKGGKTMVMSYWLVPEDVQSDRARFREWCDRAIAAANAKQKRSRAKKL
ncbi:MAG TPA: TfoX/Sxy family protein [Candidatus Paceibacterota bacterium]|nr:TfoX/Sxy family protein [Candidatus Paceibacterota bacterium]